jgi:adenylate cyclase
MNTPEKAELVPVGGGDSIPLLKNTLVMGRRESCDVCLRFPNVSGQHCELTCHEGVWYIRDMGSTNGTKVNGQRIAQRKMLRPGDEITIAKRRYKVQYTMPTGRGFIAEEEDLSMGLLEKAGLQRQPKPARPLPGAGRPKSDDEEEDVERTP